MKTYLFITERECCHSRSVMRIFSCLDLGHYPARYLGLDQHPH